MLQRQPLSLSDFSVNLRKHVDPASPAPLRLMAAKGLLPMAPQEMALVHYQLSFDGDSRVQEASRDSFGKTPDNLLGVAFAAQLPPPVLDWAAGIFHENEGVIALILSNANVDDATVARVARTAETDSCDLIAENQVRLLRTPEIVEALYMNPKARMSTVDKIVDLARRNGVQLHGLPALRPLLESDEPIIAAAAPTEEAMDAADELFGQYLSQALMEEDIDSEAPQEEEPKDDKSKSNRQHFLTNLRVPQKIRFAILGNREDRSYLVRDANRLVHMAAVASPKVTESEAIAWSGNRTIPEGVVSFIANQKDWTRLYAIKLNLLNNPKLPLPVALKLLPHLHPRDLANLARNRNVPHTLALQARQLGMKRQTGRSG